MWQTCLIYESCSSHASWKGTRDCVIEAGCRRGVCERCKRRVVGCEAGSFLVLGGSIAQRLSDMAVPAGAQRLQEDVEV